MHIAYFTENELFADAESNGKCMEIAREAQAEGHVNTLAYTGDAGSFVAFGDDGEALGYLSLSTWCTPGLEGYWENGQSVYVEQVVVSSRARGQGVARTLYQALEDTGLYSSAICSIHRDNVVSQAAHGNLGFEPVGEHFEYLVYKKGL